MNASASVTASGDTATITLTGDGDFECMLDDGPFMECKFVLLSFTYLKDCLYPNYTGKSGDMFPGLSVGVHMIKVRFTATGSSQAVMLSRPLTFTISGGKLVKQIIMVGAAFTTPSLSTHAPPQTFSQYLLKQSYFIFLKL